MTAGCTGRIRNLGVLTGSECELLTKKTGSRIDRLVLRMNVDGEDFEIETAVAGWGATNKVISNALMMN